MIFGLFLFSISLLPVMSYLTLSSQEKPLFHLFQNIIPSRHLFLLCSCFRTHPTNTTSQNIGETDAWAVTPSQIFGGTVPPVHPPVNLSQLITLKMNVSLVGPICCRAYFISCSTICA